MSSRKRFWMTGALVAFIPAAALVWWLGSPLFINRTVNEELPIVASAVTAAEMTDAEAEGEMAAMADGEDEMAQAQTEGEMEAMAGGEDEMAHAQTEGEMGSMAEGEDQMAHAQTEGAMGSMDEGEDMNEAMTEAMTAAGAVKIGTFRDGDSRHHGSGRATIYRLEDGSHILRLEDFRVTNGPDLRVYLSSHPDPENPRDVKDQGYLELGKLKGNRGNQNYEIPAGVDINGQQSVVIYCKPFSVVFSVASLS